VQTSSPFAQLHVGLDAPVDEVEARRRERRAGREHAAQRAELEIRVRLVAGLLERSEIARARPEHSDPLAFRDAPENAGIGMQRRAVVEHDRRARRERRDEPVPHHPTGRREIEHDVSGPNVRVQHVLLAVLK
jgi:hypothetical protein